MTAITLFNVETFRPANDNSMRLVVVAGAGR
jgi:hypothetical protein